MCTFDKDVYFGGVLLVDDLDDVARLGADENLALIVSQAANIDFERERMNWFKVLRPDFQLAVLSTGKESVFELC